MKRTFLSLATIVMAQMAFAQTQITNGVIVPGNSGTLLLPAAQATTNATANKATDVKSKNETGQILPKGTYATPKGSIIILPNYNAKKVGSTAVQNNNSATQNAGGLLADNSFPSLTVVPLNSNQPLTNTQTASTGTTAFLLPLTNGLLTNNQPLNNNVVSNQNLQPLTSLTNTTNSAVNTATQSVNNMANNYQPLPPLTSLPATTYSAPSTNVINGAYTTSKFNDNNSFATNNAMSALSAINVQRPNTQQAYSMPPLASIEGQRVSSNSSQFAMPPLASIEGQRTNNNNGQYVMPPLASIEGQSINTNSAQNSMPALAPIEMDYNNTASNSSIPELAPIKSNNLKGFALPKGTVLNAKTGISYTVKPLTQLQLDSAASVNDKTEIEPVYKPGAGGGMGMPALAPIEEKTEVVQEIIPALAPIENSVATVDNTIPELAPIAQQNQQPVLPRKELAIYQPQQKTVVQKKPAANPCIHTDGTYCPCCVQKPATKWAHKKKWVPKKTYRKPAAPTVVYVYQTPPTQQPAKAKQRVVYVPAQPQTYQQPQTQPQKQVQPVQQPVKQQEKVVYTDYTKVYYKEPEKPNCSCNQTTGSGSSANNPQKYYDPAKYKGLVAGPTSGDYPAKSTTTTTDEPLKYTFYVNNRGKYSVGIYNQGMTILVGQNGIVQEYRVNSDQDATNKPKVNYFGKPESVAGIPIIYNYNRSVNKIGNIKFEYDFEGFLKTVGSSNVLYNSRSNIASVDGVNVQYDGRGYVTGVDSNTDLIQYNSN